MIKLGSIVVLAPVLFIGGLFMQNIPVDVKSTVAFIYVQMPDGKLRANGTAFFVGVKDENVADKYFVYLVSAKHVISDFNGGPNNQQLLKKIFVRLDKKAGGTETIELPITSDGPNKTAYFHSDPTVDLVVIPALPNADTINYKFLPADMIADSKAFNDLKISEGSEVFFTGLFTPHLGQQKNYPVVRFGRVALVTQEKVDWGGTPMDLYLIESFSFGGNSGAPVFFYLGSDREPGSIIIGQPQLVLAGVMMGAFQDIRPIQVVGTSSTPVSTSNLGIAAVVPAYKLNELLYSDELKSARLK